MIITGYFKKTIGEGIISDLECPNCYQKGSMNYEIKGNCSHIFWIPFLPTNREYELTCRFCNRTFTEKMFTDEMCSKVKQDIKVKGKPSYPFWMYLGGSILIPFCLFIFIKLGVIWYEDRGKEEQMINLPEINDVYTVKSVATKGFYTLLKVDSLSGENVFVKLNTMEAEREFDLLEYRKDKFFSSERVCFTKKRLQELYKNDTLVSVFRVNR